MKWNASKGLLILIVLIASSLPLGCGRPGQTPAATAETPLITEAPADLSGLADGVYSVDFVTDSKMFRANEADNGKGRLTVSNGTMTLHVSLPSKSILHLFAGSAADAEKDGAALLDPTVDAVTYADGTTDEVHGFDIPVSALNEDFPLALVGTKGTWYDHTVSVTNPEPAE